MGWWVGGGRAPELVAVGGGFEEGSSLSVQPSHAMP